jgi:hypothetical protein
MRIEELNIPAPLGYLFDTDTPVSLPFFILFGWPEIRPGLAQIFLALQWNCLGCLGWEYVCPELSNSLLRLFGVRFGPCLTVRRACRCLCNLL